jgi:hypothetical protein
MRNKAGNISTPQAQLDHLPTDVADKYFNGLAGSPKLVATTNEAALGQQDSVSPHPYPKKIFNVGEHHIVKAYNTEVRNKIHKVLEGKAWRNIDILRVGHSSVAHENPVVMLITVEPQSLQYSNAMAIVKQCRTILQEEYVEIAPSDSLLVNFTYIE